MKYLSRPPLHIENLFVQTSIISLEKNSSPQTPNHYKVKGPTSRIYENNCYCQPWLNHGSTMVEPWLKSRICRGALFVKNFARSSLRFLKNIFRWLGKCMDYSPRTLAKVLLPQAFSLQRFEVSVHNFGLIRVSSIPTYLKLKRIFLELEVCWENNFHSVIVNVFKAFVISTSIKSLNFLKSFLILSLTKSYFFSSTFHDLATLQSLPC